MDLALREAERLGEPVTLFRERLELFPDVESAALKRERSTS